MRTIEPPSLVLGLVTQSVSYEEFHWSRSRGLSIVRVGDKILWLRIDSRVLRYLKSGQRYAIAYVNDGYADTITVLLENPSIAKFQQLEQRQRDGTLPTREVWKKIKPKKKPVRKRGKQVLTYIV